MKTKKEKEKRPKRVSGAGRMNPRSSLPHTSEEYKRPPVELVNSQPTTTQSTYNHPINPAHFLHYELLRPHPRRRHDCYLCRSLQVPRQWRRQQRWQHPELLLEPRRVVPRRKRLRGQLYLGAPQQLQVVLPERRKCDFGLRLPVNQINHAQGEFLTYLY
jgi:hypothetical protein